MFISSCLKAWPRSALLLFLVYLWKALSLPLLLVNDGYHKNLALGSASVFSSLFFPFPFFPRQTNGYEEDAYGSSQSRKSSRVSSWFMLLYNLSRCLMGLNLISKFFSVVKQVLPVLRVAAFAIAGTEVQQEAVLKIKTSKIRPWVGREASEFGTNRTWKLALPNLSQFSLT